MERVIKEYRPCENCRGRGLIEDNEGYTLDCPICQGYGKNLVSTRKEVIEDDEKPERYDY